MNLLISKSCSIPFGFSVFIPVVVRGALAGVSVRGGSISSLHQLEIVTLTENLVAHQAELLPSGELSGAGVAGEAGEVEDLVVGPPDPVRLGNRVATLGALRPVKSHVVNLAEDLVVLQETGGVAVQGVLTH